jgi:hypothetical protein
MLLAPESHERLETFLREHVGDPRLRLPRIRVYSGAFSRRLTGGLKVGAMTVGNRIFVAPRLVARDGEGRLTFPGWLLAHEALHVVQYAREGYLRFLFKYLSDYFAALRAGGGWDAAARMAAYLAIGHEREAREAEHAYRGWTGPGLTVAKMEEQIAEGSPLEATPSRPSRS